MCGREEGVRGANETFNNPESRDINPFLVDDNDIGAAMPDIEAVDSDATDDDEDNLDVEM